MFRGTYQNIDGEGQFTQDIYLKYPCVIIEIAGWHSFGVSVQSNPDAFSLYYHYFTHYNTKTHTTKKEKKKKRGGGTDKANIKQQL